MSDTFLPGNGFDTYEEQDKVLVGLGSGRGCRAAVRILQQQGFAVAGAVVRLSAEDDTVAAAKEAAKALGIQCITLNPDLWEQALEQEARHKITYVWVKGHAGHPENERCDQLAVAQSQAHGGRQGR